MLVRHLSRYGPVIAVNPPGTRLAPLGAARETIDSADWQSAVAGWMAHSALIVFLAPPSRVTQGLQWELRTVAEHGQWDKALVVVPPVPAEQLQARWRAFGAACAGLWPFTVARPLADPRRAGAGVQARPVGRDHRGPADRVVLRRGPGPGARRPAPGPPAASRRARPGGRWGPLTLPVAALIMWWPPSWRARAPGTPWIRRRRPGYAAARHSVPPSPVPSSPSLRDGWRHLSLTLSVAPSSAPPTSAQPSSTPPTTAADAAVLAPAAAPYPGSAQSAAPAQAVTAGTVPQAEGFREPGQGPAPGRGPAPQGPGNPADHAHKMARRLIRDNQAVYVEDLCRVRAGPHRLAKSVADAGWSQLLRLHRGEGGPVRPHVREDGRFEPTSQDVLGLRGERRPEAASVRKWTCAACGTVHDRDVNAARNILAAGRAERLNARGAGVSRRSRSQPALKQEPAGARHEPRWRNPRRSRRGGRDNTNNGVIERGREHDSARTAQQRAGTRGEGRRKPRLSVSLGLWQDRPAAEVVRTAQAADALGYGEIWIGEMATFDAFALGAVVAERTSRASLTIGPLAVAVRDPVMIAMGAASLAELTGRTVNVALGSSSPVVVEQWHGRRQERTALALAESAAAVRTLLAGGKADVRGEVISTRGFRLRTRAPGTPLTIAAFGRGAVRVGGAAGRPDGDQPGHAEVGGPAGADAARRVPGGRAAGAAGRGMARDGHRSERAGYRATAPRAGLLPVGARVRGDVRRGGVRGRGALRQDRGRIRASCWPPSRPSWSGMCRWRATSRRCGRGWPSTPTRAWTRWRWCPGRATRTPRAWPR